VKGCPYIALGCDQCGRVTPTMPTERHLDARQMERVVAGRSLPNLLLATGAMEGPFKAPHPVTRWTLAARRFTRALLAFVLAPRADLSTKD
jgi:hypothetical protein